MMAFRHICTFPSSSNQSTKPSLPTQVEHTCTVNLSKMFIPGVYQAQPEEQCIRQPLKRSAPTV